MISWWLALRNRNPGVPLWRWAWWELFWRPLLTFSLFVLYRHRAYGLKNIPETGPVLLVCNHQSFLDLLVIGSYLPRHFHSMARKTLFSNPFFAKAITALNAFPVDQERGDTAAMKTAIERLNQGHLVLVFPEGSRTLDGSIGPFARGISLILKRAKPTIIPAAVAGAYHAWPRGGCPRASGRTGVIYGEPIPSDILLENGPNVAVEMLRNQVERLQGRLLDQMRMRSDSGPAWLTHAATKYDFDED